eukprot:7031599-Prymnesium_polylepis.1
MQQLSAERETLRRNARDEGAAALRDARAAADVLLRVAVAEWQHMEADMEAGMKAGMGRRIEAAMGPFAGGGAKGPAGGPLDGSRV